MFSSLDRDNLVAGATYSDDAQRDSLVLRLQQEILPTLRFNGLKCTRNPKLLLAEVLVGLATGTIIHSSWRLERVKSIR